MQLPRAVVDVVGVEAGGLWVRAATGLLRLRLEASLSRVTLLARVSVPAALIATHGQAMARGPLLRGLAMTKGDLYVTGGRGLWRREAAGLVPVTAPAGRLQELHGCEGRLFARTPAGLEQLGAFGWSRIALGLSVRALACSAGGLVVAGDDGVWLEARRGSSGALQDLELSSWLPRPPPRFGRRARLAALAPELTLSARYGRKLDARSRPAELLWPSAQLAQLRSPREAVLRLSGVERTELWLWLRWPFGRARNDSAVAEARRADRWAARRWHLEARRAISLQRRLARASRGRTLVAALDQRLRRSEVEALVRAYGLGSAS